MSVFNGYEGDNSFFPNRGVVEHNVCESFHVPAHSLQLHQVIRGHLEFFREDAIHSQDKR